MCDLVVSLKFLEQSDVGSSALSTLSLLYKTPTI
jgi:hypothetical protein